VRTIKRPCESQETWVGHSLKVVTKDGKTQRQSLVGSLPANVGDLVRAVTANVAGFGNPADRDTDAVRRDARNGFIAEEYAKEIYGIE
jgi:N-methylhydantoinase B